MKIAELIMEVVKGNWRISNMVGYTKTFKDNDSLEAQRWMRSHEGPPPKREKKSEEERNYERRQKEWEKEERAEERAEAKLQRRIDKVKTKAELKPLFDYAVDAIGEAFPDGDPRISERWLKENGFKWSDVNKAFQAHAKQTMNEYQADMWDDYAGDAIADAESGHVDDDSPYYTVNSANLRSMVDSDDPKVQQQIDAKLKGRSDKPRFQKNQNPWR